MKLEVYIPVIISPCNGSNEISTSSSGMSSSSSSSSSSSTSVSCKSKRRRIINKRAANMLNPGPRSREGLKLSFTRSISEPNGHFPPSKRVKTDSSPSSPSPERLSKKQQPEQRRQEGEKNTGSLPSSPNAPNVSAAMDSTVASIQRSLILKKAKVIEPDALAAQLRSPQPNCPLILDCRPFIAYNVNHIRGAINVNCCDRFNRKRLQQGKAVLADLAATKDGKEALKKKSWKEVVVYDDCSENLEKLPSSYTLFVVMNTLLEDGRKPIMLRGGLRDFKVAHRAHCEDHLMSLSLPDLPSPCNGSKDIENHPATEVLPHLFLGNMRDASDVSVLHRLGIGYVLNVTSKPPGYRLDPSIKYKQLIASDNGVQNLHQFFEEAFDFIDLAKTNHSGVLIHCQAGISRSPTIAVAYLMKYYLMAMSEAYKFVKTRRSIISPNLNFMGQLWEFEQGLNNNNNNNNNPRNPALPEPTAPKKQEQEPASTSDPTSGSSSSSLEDKNQRFCLWASSSPLSSPSLSSSSSSDEQESND